MTGAFLFLAGLLAACRPPMSTQPGIVLVVLDTVRVDHLSGYGYGRPTSPTVDLLAAEGTRFDRAWSTSSWTLPAHASMFTGLLPPQHGADQSHLSLRGNPALAADLLDREGWQTAGFSNNPWISDQTGLSQGFETFRELWRPGPWYRRWWPGNRTARAVETWFDEAWDPGRPFFLFVNLMEAHGPYRPTWDAAEPVLEDRDLFDQQEEIYEAVGEKGLVRRHYLQDPPLEPEEVEAARDLYDAEIRRSDASAAAVLDLVAQRTDPSRTTVLLVTDHGEHFGEHGHMGHAFSVYEPLTRVGVVARGPDFEPGGRRSDPVQLVDLFPTVLGLAGVDLPPETEGRDLRAAPTPGRALQIAYDYPQQVLGTFPPAVRNDPALDPYRKALRAAVVGRYKLIRDSRGGEEVYDLVTDPGETTPITDLDPTALQALRAVAGEPRTLGRSRKDRDAPEATLDEATRAALSELGYLE